MAFRQTPLERAFELAKSGQVATVTEIRDRLKREGLDLSQVQSESVRFQLRALIRKAKGLPLSPVFPKAYQRNLKF